MRPDLRPTTSGPRGALRVLVVGDWCWPWYQEACAHALSAEGCDVVGFGWNDRFKYWLPDRVEPVYRSIAHKIQHRLLCGPILRQINADLIEFAARERPEAVFFYNVQLISAATVREIRRRLPNAVLCQYANDNPFSPQARASLWRHFKECIPLFDLHFAFRRSNIVDFIRAGAVRAFLLRPYFVPSEDYPVDRTRIAAHYRSDVVFAGHFEKDGRVELLEAICRLGINVKIFGGGWAGAKLRTDSPLRRLLPIVPVIGEDYRAAICGAKVALNFLSKLNMDTCTRRNFQIPAMKTVVLSERTDDLESLFDSGKEICFFSDRAELVSRVQDLIGSHQLRAEIADAAFCRVYRDGHDVQSRMRAVLDLIRSRLG